MFVLQEVCAELIQLLDIPEFNEAWLDYCQFCNASREIPDGKLTRGYKAPKFATAHSRIVAYAAAMKGNPDLTTKAAADLLSWGRGPKPELDTRRIEEPDVLNLVDEACWVSTNETPQ